MALIMREPAAFGAVDPYLSSMVVGLSNALQEHGLQFVVMMAPKDRDDAAVARYARAHVDAVLLISVHDEDELPTLLARAGSRSSPAAGCACRCRGSRVSTSTTSGVRHWRPSI
mgnify:FL=1